MACWFYGSETVRRTIIFRTNIGERVRALLKDNYADFGPRRAAVKLAGLNGSVISRETVRRNPDGYRLVEAAEAA